MNEHDWLAERFESERARLRAVAYQLLGSPSEADDAVQEAWIRISRSDTSVVENMSGWLTTIVARVSLNMLSSRNSRREDLVDTDEDRGPRAAQSTVDPEQEAVLADSVGLALMVVLDTLTPAERLAFVLHDMFGVPFEEIAVVVDRSPAAARQLASRARRRVQQAGPRTLAAERADAAPADAPAGEVRDARARVPRPREDAADPAGKAGLVRAFLAASREGQFEELLAMLDPDIVLRADQVAVRLGAEAEICGADAVTRAFVNRVWNPMPALIEGAPGLAWVHGGEPQVAFRFTIDDDRITAIRIQGDVTGLRIAVL